MTQIKEYLSSFTSLFKKDIEQSKLSKIAGIGLGLFLGLKSVQFIYKRLSQKDFKDQVVCVHFLFVK